MEILVQEPVFNRRLFDKIIVLNGHDEEGGDISGVYLVQRVDHNALHLINRLGRTTLLYSHMVQPNENDEILVNVKVFEYKEVI